MKMTDRILEKEIKENPSGFKYFCYKWTNLTNDKWYFGYHKGEVWDGYWQTSSSPELREDFSNSNINWKYEVIEWFETKEEATRYEGSYLRNNNVRTNDMSYNISEGAKPKLDVHKAQIMAKRILGDGDNASCGEFDVKFGKKEELTDMHTFQVRYQEYPDRIQYIADRIEENGGSIEYTDPLVMAIGAEDVLGFDRVRIGGKHTQKGIQKSKSATQYKYVDVDLTDWSKVEIGQLGLLLNPEDEKKRKENDNDDYEKQLLGLYEEYGIKPFEYEASQMLVGFGLNSRTRNIIANRVQKKVEDVEYEQMTGKVWKKWNVMSAEAQDLKAEYRLSDKTLVVMMSSAKMSMDNIQNKLLYSDYDKVVVVVHHPSKDWKTAWAKTNQKKYYDLMEKFVEPAGYDFEFEEASTHESDNS